MTIEIQPISFSQENVYSAGSYAKNSVKREEKDKSLEFNNNKERLVVLTRKYENDVAPLPGWKHTYINPHNHFYSYYSHDTRHGGHIRVGGDNHTHFGDDRYGYDRHRYYDGNTRYLRIHGDVKGDEFNDTEVKIYSQKGYSQWFRLPVLGRFGGEPTRTAVKMDTIDNAKLNIQNEHSSEAEVKGKGLYNNAKVQFDIQRDAKAKVKFDRAEDYTIDFYLRGRNSRAEFEDKAKGYEKRRGGHIGDKFKIKSKNDSGVALGDITVSSAGATPEGQKIAKIDVNLTQSARNSEFKFENAQRNKQADYTTMNISANGDNQYEVKGYFKTTIDDPDGNGTFKLESNKKNHGFVVGENSFDNLTKINATGAENSKNFFAFETSQGAVYKEYTKGIVAAKGEKDTADRVELNLQGAGKYLEFDGNGKSRSPQDTMIVNFESASHNYFVKAKNYETVNVDLSSETSYNTVFVDAAKKNNTTLTLALGNKIDKANDRNGGKNTFEESLALYFPVRWHQNGALYMRDMNNNEIAINNHVSTVKIDTGWGTKNITNWVKQQYRVADRASDKKLSNIKAEK